MNVKLSIKIAGRMLMDSMLADARRIFGMLVIILLGSALLQESGMQASEPPKEEVRRVISGILPSAEEFGSLIDATISVLEDLAGPMPEELHSYMQALNVPTGSRVGAIGDLHGDFESARQDYVRLRINDFFQGERSFQLSTGSYLVLLGDLTDRGYHGLEVWQLAMYLKINNPRHAFLLRGNHEDREQATMGCFPFVLKRELELKYPDHADYLLEKFTELWSNLPQAVFIGEKNDETKWCNYMLCSHASVEPCLTHKMIELLESTTKSVTNAIQTMPFVDKDFVIPTGKIFSEHLRRAYAGSMPTTTANGFNWADIVRKGINPGRDYGVLKSCVAPFLRLLHGRIYDWNWRVFCLMRGHGHMNGGILKLTDRGFTPVENKVPINLSYGDVFTLMSSPEGVPTATLLEDAFGIAHLDRSGWTLKPYITPVVSTAGRSRTPVLPSMQPEIVKQVLLHLIGSLCLHDDPVSEVASDLLFCNAFEPNPFDSLRKMLVQMPHMHDVLKKLGNSVVPQWHDIEGEVTALLS